MSIKVVFCWTHISGYMAACWRSLNKKPEIDLHVIAFASQTETAFSQNLMDGIPCHLLTSQSQNNSNLINNLILEQQPEIVVMCGWFHRPYRRIIHSLSSKKIRLVLAMDTPWRRTWKQSAGLVLLRPLLSYFDQAVVNGERSLQYAYRLGFPSTRIMQGMCGINYKAWAPLYEQRRHHRWPQSFLFVGRYVEEKALDILVKGYRIYRDQMADPWPLICCGKGPSEQYLQNEKGIINRGFVQPEEMVDIWRQAGAFLLPSRSDNWPLALIEAAASGLPLVCTDVCGSSVEVMRSGFNGLIIPSEDPDELAKALRKTHEKYLDLPVWGRRSQHLAEPFCAELWADKWSDLANDLMA